MTYEFLKISSNLPICPKCNNTKDVERCSAIKCLPNLVSHKCTKCKVYWEGIVYLKEPT